MRETVQYREEDHAPFDASKDFDTELNFGFFARSK